MPKASSVRAFSATIVFGLLGLVANLLQFAIFSDATVLLGGVFYLTIALLYGPKYGAVAALITVLPDVLPGRHPETALVLLLEAPAVGWLARRHLLPILADLIYWAVVGTPLAIMLYIGMLNYPSPSGWVMVAKHPVNGLLNLMLAELLISIPLFQKWFSSTGEIGERRPLRAYLTHGFLLVAAVPLLLLNIVNGQVYAARQQTEAGHRLEEAATAIQQSLEEYVTRHQLALQLLAQAISNENRLDTESLNRWLEQSHVIYPGFQTLAVADDQGVPIGVTRRPCRTASLRYRRATGPSRLVPPCEIANISQEPSPRVLP